VSSLLDSSVVIDALRLYAPALAFLEHLEEVPSCSEITRVEVMCGLRSGERSEAEGLFKTPTWVEVDEVVARRAGELGRAYRRSHVGLSNADLIIGATAQELGRRTSHLQCTHFPMFKGLQAPYF
jgi:predicted nucleic acid-binding protein